MKQLRIALLGCLVFGLAGVAHAAPILITDTHQPGTPQQFGSIGFTHNLMVPGGFVPAEDLLLSASLSLHISGTGGGQQFTIHLDDALGYSGSLNAFGGPLNVNVGFLQNDGLLNVALSKSTGNQFTFHSSILDAWVSKGGMLAPAAQPASVPEPAPLVLLTAGLIGLGLIRRRATICPQQLPV